MTTLVVSVFVAALLGSVHCAAMCGSFACLASRGTARGAAAFVGGSAYNLGRLGAYLSLGALAGAAGAGIDQAGAVAGLARPAAIVAGSLLVMWGVATLLASLGVRVPALAVPPALARSVGVAIAVMHRRPPAVRGFAVGALSAALPCGWLYAFVVTASAAGSALGGATVMAAFWLGTVPMMTLVAVGAQRMLGPLRTRLPIVTAVLLVIIGTLTAAGRVGGMVH